MNLPLTAVWPGAPFPRGASWDGEGVNFALFSENAQISDAPKILETLFESLPSDQQCAFSEGALFAFNKDGMPKMEKSYKSLIEGKRCE